MSSWPKTTTIWRSLFGCLFTLLRYCRGRIWKRGSRCGLKLNKQARLTFFRGPRGYIEGRRIGDAKWKAQTVIRWIIINGTTELSWKWEVTSHWVGDKSYGLNSYLFIFFHFIFSLLVMVHSQIIFSSLNIQGLKDLVKKKCTLLFCKGQKCHSLFLQDTHSVDADVTFWTNRWGDQILFSHGSNPSGGVAICFNKFPG